MIAYAIKIIADEFGVDQPFCSIFKTNAGYRVLFDCLTHGRYCKLKSWVQIHVMNNKVDLVFYSSCNTKQKTEIEFELNQPLDTQVWKSLRNKLGQIWPPLTELSKPQSDELNSILKATEGKMNNLGLKTFLFNIVKTSSGYTINRKCHKNNCGVTCRVDIINSIVTTSIISECKQNHHL